MRAGGDGRLVLFGEVDGVDDQRLGADDGLAQLFHAAGEAALHLVDGGAVQGAGAAVDQVQHRFGLEQVQLAVEVGAAGELPRLRGAAAGRDERVQYQLRCQRAAVRGDLHRVLARVAARGGEPGDEPPVQQLSRVRMPQRRQSLHPRRPQRRRDAQHHLARRRPRHAQQGHRTASRRRGDRGDGVIAQQRRLHHWRMGDLCPRGNRRATLDTRAAKTHLSP
jgi:hypothetical protein